MAKSVRNVPSGKTTESGAPSVQGMPNAQPGAGQRLSTALTRVIDKIREPLMSYVKAFGAIQETRAQLAPRVIAAFEDWSKETGRTQFVEFCRVIDPTIPTHSRDSEDGPGYKSHRTYTAMDYLRRKWAEMERAKNAAANGGASGNATPVRTAGWRMARMLATITPMIRPADRAEFWNVIGAELGLTAAQMNTLKRVAESTQPLVEVHVRPQPLKVVHVDTGEPAEAAKAA